MEESAKLNATAGDIFKRSCNTGAIVNISEWIGIPTIETINEDNISLLFTICVMASREKKDIIAEDNATPNKINSQHFFTIFNVSSSACFSLPPSVLGSWA